MKRLFPLFLLILLVGCQESVSIKPEPSASAKADFTTLSQGRKLFVVGNPDPDQPVKILWEICGSFVQSSCNIPVSRYQGKTGALLNKVPFTEDQYTVGYRIIMDDGAALVLKQSITLKGKDPILVSEYMAPKEIVDQAGLMVGKPLLDGLSVNVNKVI